MTPPVSRVASIAALTATVSSVTPFPVAWKSRFTSTVTGGEGMASRPAPYPAKDQSPRRPLWAHPSPWQPQSGQVSADSVYRGEGVRSRL